MVGRVAPRAPRVQEMGHGRINPVRQGLSHPPFRDKHSVMKTFLTIIKSGVGLDGADGSGSISYSPENHEAMVRLRARKIANIANDIPLTMVDDETGDANVVVLGWGSTWGAIQAGVRRIRARGLKVAHAHLTHLSPFPRDLGDVLKRYDKVLVPEMNLGQLSKLVRAEYLVGAQSMTKVQGVPFRAAEIEARILEMLS